MRILHVITTISPGGAENQLLGLVRLQRAAGHAVKVAYLREGGGLREELEGFGVEVSDLEMRSYRIVQAACRLRREIRSFAPTIVCAHLQPAELCARLALLGTSAAALPLVITKHNLAIFGRFPGERLLARWAARRAAALIAVSNSVKALCDRAGWSAAAGRTVTIYNAVDPAPYDGRARELSLKLRREWGASEREVVIGTVARLLPSKAIHILIQAFASYLERTKHGARLVIVGKGPLREELERLAAARKIADKVLFAGFREDIPAVTGAFDVFALTSDSEGLPVVLLEAMAAGKPVVATAVGGVGELVIDGVTGKLIAPGDPNAAAAALAFFDRAENREGYGAAGRRRVSEAFTLERMFQATMAVYDACLGQPPSPSAATGSPRA